jgi:hypothetical protein
MAVGVSKKFRTDDRSISRRATYGSHFPRQINRQHFHRSPDLQQQNRLSTIQTKISFDVPVLILFPHSIDFSSRCIFENGDFQTMLTTEPASLSGFHSLTPTTSYALSGISSTQHDISMRLRHFRFIVLPKGFIPLLPAVLS